MPAKGSSRPTICHPERKHCCKGYCQPCYNKINHARQVLKPGFKEYARLKTKRWRAANPQRARDADYRKHLGRRFGLTPEQHEHMFEIQQGHCAICQQPSAIEGKRLHVDHCHKTNQVRQLLCHHCNSGLGQFKDSIELLQAAVEYLKFHRGIAIGEAAAA